MSFGLLRLLTCSLLLQTKLFALSLSTACRDPVANRRSLLSKPQILPQEAVDFEPSQSSMAYNHRHDTVFVELLIVHAATFIHQTRPGDVSLLHSHHFIPSHRHVHKSTTATRLTRPRPATHPPLELRNNPSKSSPYSISQTSRAGFRKSRYTHRSSTLRQHYPPQSPTTH